MGEHLEGDGREFEQNGKPDNRGDNVLPIAEDRVQGDVFLSAVMMTRMAMALSDPNQEDNPLVFVNPAFVEQTGYSREEALGRNCRFLQGPGTDPATVREIHEAIDARESVSVVIYNYKHDGRGFWNSLYMCPVFDTDGRLVHYFASQVDVTELTEANLRKRENLDVVGSVASGVAHTVNNLMTVVLAGIEQAARQAVNASQRVQLDRARDAARGAGRLTQQMLSFARRQFLQVELVDLNAVVANLDDLIRQMVPGIEVAFIYAGQAVPARLDARQFELALVALVRNAAEASAPGGKVEVATREYTSFERAEGRGGRTWVELVVSDNGAGMSEETAAKATMPFFSTKAGGTGLGLPMVSGYVEQSGGRLSIETRVGHGTTVRIAFPKEASTP